MHRKWSDIIFVCGSVFSSISSIPISFFIPAILFTMKCTYGSNAYIVARCPLKKTKRNEWP